MHTRHTDNQQVVAFVFCHNFISLLIVEMQNAHTILLQMIIHYQAGLHLEGFFFLFTRVDENE